MKSPANLAARAAADAITDISPAAAAALMKFSINRARRGPRSSFFPFNCRPDNRGINGRRVSRATFAVASRAARESKRPGSSVAKIEFERDSGNIAERSSGNRLTADATDVFLRARSRRSG